jgi:hypothetical protein
MTVDSLTQLGPAYLRLQAGRCQRLSRSCMDLGTARDLRLMSEEYFAESAKRDAHARAHQVRCRASNNQGDYSDES